MLIVLAEDEPMIRMDMAMTLSDAGFDVMEASCVAEAMALLDARSGSVDGLVTDVNMPGAMDGISLAHHAHDVWPDIVVVVVSGRPLSRDVTLPGTAGSSPSHAIRPRSLCI